MVLLVTRWCNYLHRISHSAKNGHDSRYEIVWLGNVWHLNEVEVQWFYKSSVKLKQANFWIKISCIIDHILTLPFERCSYGKGRAWLNLPTEITVFNATTCRVAIINYVIHEEQHVRKRRTRRAFWAWVSMLRG